MGSNRGLFHCEPSTLPLDQSANNETMYQHFRKNYFRRNILLKSIIYKIKIYKFTHVYKFTTEPVMQKAQSFIRLPTFGWLFMSQNFLSLFAFWSSLISVFLNVWGFKTQFLARNFGNCLYPWRLSYTWKLAYWSLALAHKSLYWAAHGSTPAITNAILYVRPSDFVVSLNFKHFMGGILMTSITYTE